MGYHDGLRVWKEDSSGNRTYFLYDGIDIVCELDEDGYVVATNTYGANGLIARNDGEESVVYTFDDGGNVIQLLDDTGAVITTEQYDAYGNRIAGTNDTPYCYQGQYGYYTDSETGLILATNRYYDPTEGRWLIRDPIGYAGGLNLYGYCGNNPVNYSDPLGLCEDGGGSWLGDLYNSWKNGELGKKIPILGDLAEQAGTDWGKAETGQGSWGQAIWSSTKAAGAVVITAVLIEQFAVVVVPYAYMQAKKYTIIIVTSLLPKADALARDIFNYVMSDLKTFTF